MPPGVTLSMMALFRPCKPGQADHHEDAAPITVSRGQVLSRGRTRYRGFRGAFVNGLHILLAIILLHDIFAPHPFAPPMILFDGNLSVQTPDEGHPSTGEFVEDDENTSVPNRRGILTPVLYVNFNLALRSFFHQLLLIVQDERPPKA